MNIADDLSQTFLEGFEAGKWDMFIAITNAYHGKQYYFLQDNDKVYSRDCCGYLTREQAYLEFINRLWEEG